MTKKEIVKDIADILGLTQLKTKEIVQMTFDAIIETLVHNSDHRIELRNFGVFEVKQRAARKARNPRTGERVDVPPKNVVTFKPGKRMEELVHKIKDAPPLRPVDDDEDMEDEETTSQDPVKLPFTAPVKP
ncbi:MAG TPA: HU family DNA-binding protein [Gemmatales bacterium]|nr:HU family DNA-binding protein [Gemmatales bacterium]